MLYKDQPVSEGSKNLIFNPRKISLETEAGTAQVQRNKFRLFEDSLNCGANFIESSRERVCGHPEVLFSQNTTFL